MKKNFLSLVALASMLFATSCQESVVEPQLSGPTTFTVQLPDQMGTKAIGGYDLINRLYVAVYSEDGVNEIYRPSDLGDDGNELGYVNFDAATNSATVSLNLIKDQKYDIIFWAQKDDAYFTTNLRSIPMAANQLYHNSEDGAAFFHFEDNFEPVVESKNIVLRRPFAQLNLGTTEKSLDTDVQDANLVLSKSYIKIENVASSFNTITGEGEGEQVVEFALTKVPAERLTVSDIEYYYVSMNYLPILGNDKDLVTVTAKILLESGQEIDHKFESVPLQENYRTNIVGNLISSTTDFEVKIDQIFAGEYNNGESRPVSINGEYYATIQDAVNAAVAGDVIKVSSGTYEEVVDVRYGKDITIEAVNGEVVIASLNNASNGNPSKVLVKGVTFDNSLDVQGYFTGTGKNLVPCVGSWGGELSFEDCKFIVSGEAREETGVMTWYVTETNPATLNFENCIFEAKGSKPAFAMQIYDFVDMTASNCIFKTGYPENIDGTNYTMAVKYVGETGFKATLENNIVENVDYFVELGSSAYPGENYAVNIINNTLGVGVNTHIIANDENQTVNCSGNVAMVAEDLILEDGKYYALSGKGLKAAFGLGVTDINLRANTYDTKDFSVIGKTITLRGVEDGVKIFVNQTNAVALGTFDGCNVTFENITIETLGGNYKGFARMSATYNNCTFEHLYFTQAGAHTFNGCTFNAYTGEEHCTWTYGAESVKYNNCTFNYTDRAVNVYTEAGIAMDVEFENCKFNTNNELSLGAVEINSSRPNTISATVRMNNCTAPQFGEMVFIPRWDSSNGAKTTVYVNGNLYDTPIVHAVVKDAAGLAKAVKDGCTVINLLPGEYDVYDCGGKNLVLNGREEVVFKIMNDGEAGLDAAFDGSTVTFNNITFNTLNNTGSYKGYTRLTGIYNNCNFIGEYCSSNNTHTFNNCTFDTRNGYFWTWGATSVTFDGCEWGTNSKAILAHGGANTVININNCKFNATEKGYTGAGDWTSVVEIDPTGSNHYTINFTGENTKTEFYSDWTRVKDGSTGHIINGLE